jgi:HD-GYP domain-containing protein (c-di-GMP phosphodiesterase class II)
VLGLEPAAHRSLEGAELDEALTVMADFIDLKSPYMAATASDARSSALRIRRRRHHDTPEGRLVHEFGTTAVPNSIWDKPGPLTR